MSKTKTSTLQQMAADFQGELKEMRQKYNESARNLARDLICDIKKKFLQKVQDGYDNHLVIIEEMPLMSNVIEDMIVEEFSKYDALFTIEKNVGFLRLTMRPDCVSPVDEWAQELGAAFGYLITKQINKIQNTIRANITNGLTCFEYVLWLESPTIRQKIYEYFQSLSNNADFVKIIGNTLFFNLCKF